MTAAITRRSSASTPLARRRGNRLYTLSGLSLLGIVLILYSDFQSTRIALLLTLSLPFALVGAVWIAFLSGGVLSLGSLVGFVTVIGIAARNGIMLVSHYRHLEQEEGVPVQPRVDLTRFGRTSGAHSDDRAHDHTRVASDHRGGKSTRLRNRAPDGRSHRRRTLHFHRPEPCARPSSLRAIDSAAQEGSDWLSEGTAGARTSETKSPETN